MIEEENKQEQEQKQEQKQKQKNQNEEKKDIDFVSFINICNINNLSFEYNINLVEKIKKNLNKSEQMMFMANHYFNLENDYEKEFVILFNTSLWKWLGYYRVEPCKKLLFSNFKENVDYIITKNEEDKEIIKMTINCFKEFCIIANKNPSINFNKYYIKINKIFNDEMNEYANNIREQFLKNKNKN